MFPMNAMKSWKCGVRRVAVAGAVCAALLLTGCDNFFVKPTSGSGGGGGGTTTGGNFVYVGNATTKTVSGFLVGSGTLTSTPNSPYSIGFTPLAAVVTPSNSVLYVAGPGALYAYPIGSDGSLSSVAQAPAVAVANVSSLDVSPDGKWLFGLDSVNSAVDAWSISNSTTGALGQQIAAPYSVSGPVVVVRTIRVSPTGTLVFASLGTGGDQVFTFDSATGSLASSQHLDTGSATTSDNALAVDSTGARLYIARSGTNGGLAVYSIGAAGALQQISGSPYATGSQPYDVLIDSTGKYVYTANRTDGTISGFTIGTGGALTALSGSPFASGTQVSALARDKSGKYVLAAAIGGSPDLTMYGFDSTVAGKLTKVTTTTTGTDPTGAYLLAATH